MAPASREPSTTKTKQAKIPLMIEDGRYYPHPDDLDSWSDDMKWWPGVTSGDIVYYLLSSKACDLKDVKAYKSLESYNYLQCGWVGKLLVHKVDNEIVFVKGEVTPSQAVHNRPHSVWICAKYSGTVLTAGCTCMAGKARVCSHVGAVLWKIDLAVCNGLTGISCTDTVMQWNRGTKQNVEPAVLGDVSFKMQRRILDPDVKREKRAALPSDPPMDDRTFKEFMKSSPLSPLFNVKGILVHFVY
ncbi:uncharacterized protein LOC135371681 [Ornithodoros turicata]|uniref:uncharacterized protein LOC135371681 n=1 Tax=Ornithodoros turicata TaxID=34597 RepID=UPI00313875DF